MIAVHLIGGLFGTLMVGLFADEAINPIGDGLFYGGGWELFKDQAVASVRRDRVLRCGQLHHRHGDREDDRPACRAPTTSYIGLDQSQHAESAYQP